MKKLLYGLTPVAVAVVVRALLEPWLEEKSPFLLFTLAVMLAAAYGGVWVGAIATLLGGAAGIFFLTDTSRGLHDLLRSDHWLQPFLYLLVCTGVTAAIEALHRARRRAEAYAAKQAKLAAELGEANRVKDEFLATLSHELRTPLTAIVGWANVLMTGALDAPAVTRAVEVIHRNATIQNQLISDILDVARITSGKLRLDPRPMDPGLAVAAAVETIRPAARAKKIDLDVATAPGSTVWGDPDRLQQVFWNLLSNAVKFTPAGGQVTVRLETDGGCVWIVVADAGPGLRPDFIPHAFERFRQDDTSTTRRQGGLGLGLAIVRHLVELHGGTVSATNRADEAGAVFEVALPRMATGPGRSVLETARTWMQRPDLLAGVRVLVVDDDGDARNLLRWILEAFGAEVWPAASVSAAVEAVRTTPPDVILTDIAMPQQDGYDLLERLRALTGGRAIPTAAISAFTSERERARAIEAGFMAHLAKPVDPEALAEVIHHLVTT